MPHRKPEHLYVMQNQFGLVKIGKSVDVELRRRRLSKADNCEITLVHATLSHDFCRLQTVTALFAPETMGHLGRNYGLVTVSGTPYIVSI